MRKRVYPYEYMDDWEKFNETLLPEKEDFCSHLNMEDTTDADLPHPKRVCKDFEIRNLGEYYDSYVQSDTLLSADEIYLYLLIYTLEICVLRYMTLILQNFFQHMD